MGAKTENRIGEGHAGWLAGRILAAPVAGGKGKVEEEIEEVELYPLVGLDGVGGGRTVVDGEE